MPTAYGAWDKDRCDKIGERSIAAAEWMAGLAEETEGFSCVIFLA